MNIDVSYKLLKPEVQHPSQMSKGYAGSAAHDLYLPRYHGGLSYNAKGEVRLDQNQAVTVPLGIAIHINNPNVAAIILPRSGTGTKGLVVGNLVGLIDQDYQGELMVSLWNRTDDTLFIDPEKAVAQLTFVPVVQANLVKVDDFGETTDRGVGGFGSSDKAGLLNNFNRGSHE